jgi:hypothetical protein
MKTIFYKKQGRRYIPVSEYDNELLDGFPKGDHLVSVYPGGVSRRFSIDPALAPMIAAGRYAEEAICTAIGEASKLKPSETPLTPEQQAAWINLSKAFGKEMMTLQGLSIRDCAEAGVKAMQVEADRLMQNEAVRKAYDHFMLMCKMVKDNEY